MNYIQIRRKRSWVLWPILIISLPLIAVLLGNALGNVGTSSIDIILYIIFFIIIVGGTLLIRLDHLIMAYFFCVLVIPLKNPEYIELGIFQIMGFSVHIYDILVLLLLSSFLARLALGQFRFKLNDMYLPMGAFLFWLALSTFIGIRNGNSRNYIIDDLVCLMSYFILVPAAVVAFNNPKKQARLFLFTLLSGLTLNGIIVAFSAGFTNCEMLSKLFVYTPTRYRIGTSSSVLTIWPIIICIYMLIFIPKLHKGIKLFIIIVLVCSFYNLIISMSRMNLIATIVAIPLLFVLALNRRTKINLPFKGMRFLFIIIILLFVLHLSLSYIYKDQYDDLLYILSDRFTGRLQSIDIEPRKAFYNIAWPLILENPFGQGTGASWIWCGKEISFMDSTYLTFQLKYGIVSIFILLCWFGLLLSKIVKLYKNKHLINDVYAQSLIIVLALMVPLYLLLNLNTAHLFYNRPTVIMMSIIMGWVEKMWEYYYKSKNIVPLKIKMD